MTTSTQPRVLQSVEKPEEKRDALALSRYVAARLDNALEEIMTAPVQTKAAALSLIAENQDKLKAVGVRKLGLFGPFVRGEHRAESDVDLLVEFEHDKKTFDNFIELCFLLEDLFKRRVELVTAESLSPYLRPRIMREVEYVAFVA